MSGPVSLDREDSGLAVVTFDSPPLNLFDDAMGQGLTEAVEALDADPPRAVLFRAENRAFTAGVDVKVFAAIESPADAERMFGSLIRVAETVERLPCPTVLAAHAMCLTWGFELALACDFLVAAEGAQFGLVESRIGLTPAMGGTQRLAERAGTGRAREFVMTGGLYDAATLERWNVVNRVYGDDEFAERSRKLADKLAAGPTRAHAATKDILRAYLEGGIDGANAMTAEAAGALWDTEDLRNGVQSFLSDGPGNAAFHGR
ncbi:MAG TPA: enoyl-CoA hydratase/isomerase family protein [Solirubrobacteraceae bacterium]